MANPTTAGRVAATLVGLLPARLSLIVSCGVGSDSSIDWISRKGICSAAPQSRPWLSPSGGSPCGPATCPLSDDPCDRCHRWSLLLPCELPQGSRGPQENSLREAAEACCGPQARSRAPALSGRTASPGAALRWFPPHRLPFSRNLQAAKALRQSATALSASFAKHS